MSELPARVLHYRIVAHIGRGATGDVYRAIDERLGRSVALKILLASISDSDEVQARMLREARAASSLNHPGIVTIHDIGNWQGRVFIVMELVDGQRFSDLARAGISTAEALRLLAEVADALGAAHARAVLHRDVKSDNLMRTRDGHAKVLDFGLAKLLDELAAPSSSPRGVPAGDVSDIAATIPVATSSAVDRTVLERVQQSEHARSDAATRSAPSQTMLGSIIGTPAYMSPEQATGGAADARSEVFSLGVVAYELVCGRRPFDRRTIDETLDAVRALVPEPPSRVAPARAIDADLDALVLRALDKNPAKRFADMHSFADAIRAHASRRSRRITPIAALLTVAIVAGGLVAHRARAPIAPVATAKRRLTFDTGCSSKPTFTHDGKAIVYDATIGERRELRTLSLETTTTRRLRDDAGDNWRPTQSPDGRWLAWMHSDDHGRQALIADYANGGAPIYSGPTLRAPSWTARNELIVPVDEDTLVRVTIKDGVATASTIGVIAPAVHLTAVVPFADDALIATWKVDADTSEEQIGWLDATLVPRKIVDTARVSGLVAAPSQRAFYYTRRIGATSELVRHERESGVEAVVGGGIVPTSFAISPDGERLVYSTCAPVDTVVRWRPQTGILPLEATGTRDGVDPVVLDDRRTIYTMDRGDHVQLVLIDESTESVRTLAVPGSHAAGASSDGAWVAYSDSVNGGMFIARVAGGPSRRLTSNRTDAFPVFSPDGKTIYFQRDEETTRVWRISTDGTDLRVVGAPNSSAPAVSPTDGRVFYLQDDKDSRVLMELPSGGEARLSPIKWPGGLLEMPHVSSDGARIAMLRNSHEVVDAPTDGSAPATSRWIVSKGAIDSFAYTADGKGFVAAIRVSEGDLWLANGDFR